MTTRRHPYWPLTGDVIRAVVDATSPASLRGGLCGQFIRGNLERNGQMALATLLTEQDPDLDSLGPAYYAMGELVIACCKPGEMYSAYLFSTYDYSEKTDLIRRMLAEFMAHYLDDLQAELDTEGGQA
jgi:hypothetical protein